MSEPTCRGCYAATLTPDALARFNAEPTTTSVYLCPKHHAHALQRLNFLFKVGPNEMFAPADWHDATEAGA